MENTTDYLKPYLLLICRKKQKIGTGKVRDNSISEEDITPETSLIEDFAADSLDLYELMMALEEEFNVEIPQELANDIVYVEDIVRVLKELGVEE